jgi:hypothetical protein
VNSSVTCIMPTANRRRFIPFSIRLFLAQDYPNKELIIVDDGEDSIADLLQTSDQLKYIRREPGDLSLGEKRNLACEHAKGDVIMHWDDDDWYSPWRISYQLACLKTHDSELCGTSDVLFVDARSASAWEYRSNGYAHWLCGASLCYTKALWQQHRFADVKIGEDNRFVRSARQARIGVIQDNRFLVVRVHSNNTCTKRPTHWPSRSFESMRSIIGRDWSDFVTTEGLTAVANPHDSSALSEGPIRMPVVRVREPVACRAQIILGTSTPRSVSYAVTESDRLPGFQVPVAARQTNPTRILTADPRLRGIAPISGLLQYGRRAYPRGLHRPKR